MIEKIHKTSIISGKAEIESDVYIGPYCIIKEGVKIKNGSRLMSNVIIDGNTEIGLNCLIYPFVTIGLPPQDIKYKNEQTGIKIGDNNIIREYTSIHRASIDGDGFTNIGNSNFLMGYVHIAHDCKIGNSVIMANSAVLGGHVVIEDFAVIGGVVAIHQFVRLGAYSMLGGFSAIGQDVPPFMIAAGGRERGSELHGLNIIGLKRYGFSSESINTLKKAYSILFKENRLLKDALDKIKAEFQDIPEIKQLVEFIEKSKRGICR